MNDFAAFDECRAVAAAGFLVGGSAGLNIVAAQAVASSCAQEAPRDGGVTIVTLLCDHGIKYLSKVTEANARQGARVSGMRRRQKPRQRERGALYNPHLSGFGRQF